MTHRRVPHELELQAAIHTCWPADVDLWEEDLVPAQEEFARFLTLLAQPVPGGAALPLVVYAASQQARDHVSQNLTGPVRIIDESYGDVWLRDTGPVFVRTQAGLKAVRFRFNGWGGKYDLEGDQTIGLRVGMEADPEADDIETLSIICEGGALEFDGEGTCLTTRQCVLNSNRNPGLTEQRFEDIMAEYFGVSKVIWIDEGLVGDHTDGHIDNIARFAAPGLVVCQSPNGNKDPNLTVLKDISRQLESATDAKGRKLSIVEIPSPGLYEIDGEPAAASHMNWVIGCRNVVMPAYNAEAEKAVSILQGAFPDRRVVSSSARHILTGGGAFHCVTCNQPAV